MTPWKAQGLTLKKAIVKLSRAVVEPGVLFVALSRVEHPDNLMLDDDFPDYSTILRQKRHASFQMRQAWEKNARSIFSHTIRHYMRDPSKYSEKYCWSGEESDVADELLKIIRAAPELSDEDVAARLREANTTVSEDLITKVQKRMQTYPHMFHLEQCRHRSYTILHNKE